MIAFREGLPKSKQPSPKSYLVVKDSVGESPFTAKLQFFSSMLNVVEPFLKKISNWLNNDSIPILWPERYCYQVIGHNSGTQIIEKCRNGK